MSQSSREAQLTDLPSSLTSSCCCRCSSKVEHVWQAAACACKQWLQMEHGQVARQQVRHCQQYRDAAWCSLFNSMVTKSHHAIALLDYS